MKRYIRLRSALLTVSALALLGFLGVSSDAGNPKPVLITVSGAIQGSGTDATAMAITFSGLKEDQVKVSYVANPDRSLTVYGTGRTGWTLSYYFCNHESHAGSAEPCSDPAHDPDNYRRLKIKEGALAGKGQPVLVVFQATSSWEIWRKAQPLLNDPPEGVLEASGHLTEPVTYQETLLR